MVLTGLTAALGAPDFDNTRTYPTADGDRYLDTIEEESFTHPVGRTVCFANDLCAQFGGDTDGTLTFTGWEVTTDAAPRLFTANGISIGSVMSDFLDSAQIADGGCYTVGYGDASGVTLTLLSSGEPFASFDDDGNYVLGSPPPDDIEVLGMSSGDLPYFLYEDC